MTRKNLIALLLVAMNASGIVLFSQEKKTAVLSMDSCIQIALSNNYALKVFAQDKEIALQNLDIQKADLMPRLDLTSEYLFSNQYEGLNQDYTASARLEIYQPLWQNKKIRTTVKYSKKNTEAAEVIYAKNESNTIYNTIKNYNELLRDIRIRKLTNRFLQQFSITLDAAKERYRLGISRKSDVSKAETEYSNIKYLAIQSQTSEKVSRQKLLKIIGYPLDANILLTETIHESLSMASDSLLSIANRNSPELKIIRKQIQLQQLSTEITCKDQMPTVGAVAAYNWIENPLSNKEFFGSIGISLRMNMFNGSKKKNQIGLEKIKTEQLNLNQMEVLQAVANEIQIIQLQLIESREKIENAKVSAKNSKETLELTQEEYIQGLSSMLELIDAQYTDFIANKNLINAQTEYQIKLAQIKRSTGILMTEYKKQK